MTKHQETFTKGYTANWTNDVIKISLVERTNPTTYKLEGMNIKKNDL